MTLIDPFGREINYLRLSVTDRCDFRCVYCMAEDMKFIPREQLLTIEEMTIIAQAFVELGVKKIRITGGEPLIRRNVRQLFSNLGKFDQLQQLTLTTNGAHIVQHIDDLVSAGVKTINISLDSLQPKRFRELTRTGHLTQVLAGIDAAINAGMRVKLNAVILKNRNSDEINDLVQFAIDKALDISFIEEMPLGNINEHQRDQEFISSEQLRTIISQRHTLTPMVEKESTSGPARYWHANQAHYSLSQDKQKHRKQSRIGFISPHSNNFCGDCNRVRLTATGTLLLCLGNEHAVDLKAIVRQHPGNMDTLKQSIIDAMTIKPEKHEFDLHNAPQIVRFMNMTGG